MTRILLTYDTPNWAFHLECQALAWHLQRWAPGEFEPVLCLAGREPEDWEEFDIVYSSAWYDQRLAHHPKSVSQVASHTYWQNGWDSLGGRPKLASWKHLAAKNRGIFDKLTPEDHPAPRLLYNQFNPERWPYSFSGPSGGAFFVGFVGHATSNKGYLLIKDATKLVAGAVFVEATWEGHRIPTAEMAAWYQYLGAYVCASELEGGPRPGIEAGLCGAPIVTTKAGQLGEMVEDGITALVVERDELAIAEAVMRLSVNEDLRQKLASNAREAFSQRVVADGQKWVEWLREIARS